jgi:phosphatidylglycerophosphatase A
VKVIIRIIASGLYAGYFPVAPGTIGSLLGVVIYLLLRNYPVIFIFVTMVLFIIGFFVCAKAEEIFNEKDSGKIVIDEIASMCLVCLFIKPGWFMVLTGFLIFRFFDVVKLPPARKAEKLPGSLGIMLDDVIAAVYTIIILFIIYLLDAAGIFPSFYI